MKENRPNKQSQRSKAPAADRMLTILELMTESETPLSLTEIASRAEIPLASCSAIMHTLAARGYASEQVVGRTHLWQPTLAIYQLGARLISRFGLAECAQPHLERLSDALGVPAHAGVLEGEQVIYIAKAAGESFVQFHTFIGRAAPFRTTALGKAIAAFLPEPSRETLLRDSGSPKSFRAELESSAAQGYAIEDEEEYEGIGCVAAPVFDATRRCVGGISVTGFRAEVLDDGRQEATVATVRAAAAAISADMGAPSDSIAVLQ